MGRTPGTVDLEHYQALREFAMQCLESAWQCNLDSIEAQEVATKLGICVAGEATEDDCAQGFEGEPGDIIYRLAPWLNEAECGERSAKWVSTRIMLKLHGL